MNFTKSQKEQALFHVSLAASSLSRITPYLDAQELPDPVLGACLDSYAVNFRILHSFLRVRTAARDLRDINSIDFLANWEMTKGTRSKLHEFAQSLNKIFMHLDWGLRAPEADTDQTFQNFSPGLLAMYTELLIDELRHFKSELRISTPELSAHLLPE